jgi:HEAT repeat protein
MRVFGKVFLLLVVLALFLSVSAFAADKVEQLIEQLQGKSQYYDGSGEPLGFFASWTTRHYEEQVRIYAARLLVKEVNAGNRDKILQALIEVLKKGADDRDTGDGIVYNRSEIAFALAKIGDERAIEPLLQTLIGREKLPMINAKAGPEKIIIRKTSANLNIIKALGVFRGIKADNAAALMEQFLIFEQDPMIADHLRESIDLIVNKTDLSLELNIHLRPSRP